MLNLKKTRIKAKDIELWMMCIIPVLLIFVFSYLPMGGLIIAFKDYKFNKGIFGSEWTGLKNFELFFSSNEFTKIAFNTIYLNCLFIVFGTLAALAVAILLFNLKSRLSTKIYQTVMITPHFMSWVIVSYMVYTILCSNGVINNIIQSLGGESVDWYSKPEAWPAILTICAIWKNVGMDSVIYYAALMGVDATLFEAADIDGAGRWKKITKIIIPELTSIITIMTILKIGGIFRADFGLFYNVTLNIGTLYPTTDVVDTYIYRALKTVNNLGVSTAVGLLQSLVGFVLVMVTNGIVNKINSENALF